MTRSYISSNSNKPFDSKNRERDKLYNECKDNLLLFSNSDKNSIALEGKQLTFKNADESHNSLQYLSNSIAYDKIMEDIHPELFRQTIGEAIRLSKKKYADYRHIEPKILNSQISRIHSKTDTDQPISHGVITKLYDRKHPGMPYREANLIGIDDPDKYRKDAIKALLKAEANGVIYGLEQGANGLWHFHFMSYGWMKPHNFILNRTGWGYIKIPEDRNEYFNIDEDIPKRIRGFHPTAKYCLEKHHPHKKAYVIFGS